VAEQREALDRSEHGGTLAGKDGGKAIEVFRRFNLNSASRLMNP
jgi:hypothetical protein